MDSLRQALIATQSGLRNVPAGLVAESAVIAGAVRQAGRHAGDKRSQVKFSAAAVCELVHGNRYRIADPNPGRFDD